MNTSIATLALRNYINKSESKVIEILYAKIFKLLLGEIFLFKLICFQLTQFAVMCRLKVKSII